MGMTSEVPHRFPIYYHSHLVDRSSDEGYLDPFCMTSSEERAKFSSGEDAFRADEDVVSPPRGGEKVG